MIVIKYPNGDFASSPAAIRVPKVGRAGTYETLEEAQHVAKLLGNGAEAVEMPNPWKGRI